MSAERTPRVSARTRWLAGLGTLVVVGAGLVGFWAAVPGAHATPWTGSEPTPTNLELFFHNSTLPVPVGAAGYLLVMSTVNDTQGPWATTGEVSIAPHYDSVSFVMAPQLAGPLVLNGSIVADVYLNQSGSSLTGGSIVLAVNEVSPTGNLTLLATGPSLGTGAIGSGGSVPNLVSVPGPTISNQTVPAGDSVEVSVTISGTSATNYGIWWGNVSGTVYASEVDLPVSTYLTVSSPAVLNSTGAPVADLTATGGNQTLTIRANVSDPLGAYDFESFPVYFTIFNVSDVAVYGPVAMTPTPLLALPGALAGSYSTQFNYSALGPGTYAFTVNATDNTEHNTAGQNTLPSYFGRVASASTPIVVGLPPVPVVLLAVDEHSQPLSGATVRVLAGSVPYASNRTDASGEAGFNLSNGSSFTAHVFWQNVAVGSFAFNVTGAGQLVQLNASVIYPTFLLQTATGSYPLAYALVDVVHPNGSELPLEIANAQGKFTLDQVPVGNYTLTVIYDDTEVVSERAVAAASDGPIVVDVTGVFSLSVLTTTATGGGLSGVFVTVVNVTTGATIASGISNGAGELTFLVPAGTYDVNGSWSETYYLTPLSQSVSKVVAVNAPTLATLSFSKAFPPFTQTNEFYLLVGFAALAAVIVVLAVLLARRRKQTMPPLSPAPAISPPEATKEETKQP